MSQRLRRRLGFLAVTRSAAGVLKGTLMPTQLRSDADEPRCPIGRLFGLRGQRVLAARLLGRAIADRVRVPSSRALKYADRTDRYSCCVERRQKK